MLHLNDWNNVMCDLQHVEAKDSFGMAEKVWTPLVLVHANSK